MATVTNILEQRLTDIFGTSGDVYMAAISGGSINDTYKITYSDQTYFCKVNSATKFPQLFNREKEGLQMIARHRIIATPAVVDLFEAEGKQFLLLQWIQEGERTDTFWKKFGEQLAALHRVSAPYFGLTTDNYMGSVPQQNTVHNRWDEFFSTERLHPMVKKCSDKGLLGRAHLVRFDMVQKHLASIFAEEPPSLLHGDLWSGNLMCNAASEPVLIDPAVYFGHRSVDLAMTTLFGGFHAAFYEAYHFHFPLPNNYKEQWDICNLYPLLVHLYLFGTGYLSQIDRILKKHT